MRVDLLGPVIVQAGGQEVIYSPGGRKLISVLTVEKGKRFSSQHLISLLWEDPAARAYKKDLHRLFHEIRRTLPEGRIVTARTSEFQTYALAWRDGDNTDVDRLREMVGQGNSERNRGHLDEAAGWYRDALSLWRARPGERLLPDFPDTEGMRGHRDRLEVLRRYTTEAYSEVRLALGDYPSGLVDDAKGFLRRDPTNEHLLSILMHALYRAGRRTEALAAYRSGAETLREELGVEPGVEMRRMRDRIAAEDPQLSHIEPPVRKPLVITDRGRPTSAGVSDYARGGKDHYGVDEQFLADLIERTGTDVWKMTTDKRECATRMIRFAATTRGINQWIDLGSGMTDPQGLDLCRVARQVSPGARVLMVDIDPRVEAHANAKLVDSKKEIAFYRNDVVNTEAVLRRARIHFNWDEPVGLLCCNTLQDIGDAAGPMMKAYIDALAVGSAVIITHLSGLGLDPRLKPILDVNHPESVFKHHLRSPEEISAFFCGLTPISPGLVDVGEWRPDQQYPRREMRIFAGLAFKGEDIG